MHPLTGAALAAAFVLVAAGLPKFARPATTVGALRSVGLPASSAVVRMLSAAEVVVGSVAAVAGGRVASALVAASYAAFTIFLVLALRRDGAVSSCGCVGRADTPPTWSHLIVTVVLGGLGGVAVVMPSGGLVDVFRAGADGPLTVVFAGLAAWFVWLVVADLPRLKSATS